MYSKSSIYVFSRLEVVYKECKANKKQEGLVKLEDLTATSRLAFGIAEHEEAFADRATGTLVLNRYINDR